MTWHGANGEHLPGPASCKTSDQDHDNSRNFINFSATKGMLISKQNLKNGSAFITFTGHMAHSTEKHLTKRLERSYNQFTKCPTSTHSLQKILRNLDLHYRQRHDNKVCIMTIRFSVNVEREHSFVGSYQC